MPCVRIAMNEIQVIAKRLYFFDSTSLHLSLTGSMQTAYRLRILQAPLAGNAPIVVTDTRTTIHILHCTYHSTHLP